MILTTYQLTTGFGVASTTHSSLIDSSLFIGAKGSGTLINTGAPKQVDKFKNEYVYFQIVIIFHTINGKRGLVAVYLTSLVN